MYTTTGKTLLTVSLAAWKEASDVDRRSIATEVDAAASDPGVLVLSDHGIDSALQDAMSHSTREFFALPVAAKAARRDASNQYVGFRGRDNHNSLGGADAKEMFHIGPSVAPTLRGHDRSGRSDGGRSTVDEALATSALWPTEVPAMVETWHKWWSAMQDIAVDLLGIFAAALPLDRDEMLALGAGNHSDLAANYYPAPLAGSAAVIRNAIHSDVTLFTVLWQDGDEQGLVVHWRDGTASPVAAGRDVLVVNFGQLAEIMTDHRWRAVPHEVVPVTEVGGAARVSVPFFYRPAPTTFVASIHDPSIGVVAGPWLDQKRPPLPAAAGNRAT